MHHCLCSSVVCGVTWTQVFIRCTESMALLDGSFFLCIYSYVSSNALVCTEYNKREVRWVPQVWIFLLYGNAILQGILNILFHIPFVHMLFLTHIMLFSGVISMICLLWKEYKRSEAEELLFCLRAFATLGVSGVTALILYCIFDLLV